MTDPSDAIRSLKHATSTPSPRSISTSNYYKLVQQSRAIPQTSNARLRRSLSEPHLDLGQVGGNDIPKQQTYLYLGYGSNMCALTFLKQRQIRPISQVNVVCPDVRLTFDLSGIPYTEPCFANIGIRTKQDDQFKEQGNVQIDEYNKDSWHKGLVAVVYEVTAEDFAHILATEGGGMSYHWEAIECFSLSPDPSEPVPVTPKNLICKAYTLYSSKPGIRHDPSYAQPSARYMKLLTDGGLEHNLPIEYRDYLAQIRPYVASTKAQTTGAALFATTWVPVTLFFFRGNGLLFLKKNGKYPDWYAKMALAVFSGVWNSYDRYFKSRFGDGERTIEDGGSPRSGDNGTKKKSPQGSIRFDEKEPLLAEMT